MTAPNIILIIFDDMTFEQLQRMPQFMKLGLTGVMFTNAFVSTAICQPARMTLLTGQYSHNNGIVDNSTTGYPPDHSTMLPARMQAAGYQTCHVGKYLNSYNISVIPTGWNEWHAINPQQYFGYSINDNGVTTSPPDYNTTITTARAVSYINTATQPFFMQVAYMAPHFDTPSVDFLNATPDAAYSGVVPTARLSPRNTNFNVQMGTPPAYMAHAIMDSAKINEIDAFWRGSTEVLFSADQGIAAIQAALIAAGKTNTVVMVTSDNGYMRGEGRDPAEKLVPYMPDVRIPFIVSGPSNLVAQNKVCSQLVSHVDISATIMALGGATATRVQDGVSLTPLLTTPSGPAIRNYLMLEWRGLAVGVGTGWALDVPDNRTIVTNGYFYTFYDATGETELYDLRVDPYQLVNVAGLPAYADIQANLASRLNTLKTCAGSNCIQ